MKVILQQDVKTLGKKGTAVEVAEGYARNYLIPRGIAIEANASALKSLAQEKSMKAKKQARAEKEAVETAQRLASLCLTVKAKAGENGKLFGSITSADIAEAIERQADMIIDKRKIELPEPIKALGGYTVSVRLHPGITTDVKIKVEAE